jgi:molecular chaperone GrpE
MENKDESKAAVSEEENRKENNGQQENNTPADENDAKPNEIADLKNKLQEAKNDLLLAQAENENLRKRMQRQIEESHKFAVTGFAKDVVGTLDDLYRAIDNAQGKQNSQDSFDALYKGIELTRSNFEKSLARHGINRLYPKNEKFDYRFHEALSQVPSDQCEDETVLEVVQAGYSIKDKMLKHAQVIVAIPKKE